LNCIGAPQVGCGLWTFEVPGNTEGFNVPSASNLAQNNPANIGGTTVAPAPGSGHGNALALRFASNDCADLANCHINLTVFGTVCPGGAPVHLGPALGMGNNFVKIDVYFDKTGGDPASTTNGPFWFETWNGATFVNNSGDKGINANQWQTFVLGPGASTVEFTDDVFTELHIHMSFSTSSPWTGTMFIDNIRFAATAN
jgi:hypothetical protein